VLQNLLGAIRGALSSTGRRWPVHARGDRGIEIEANGSEGGRGGCAAAPPAVN
jgi:hypothetical protein